MVNGWSELACRMVMAMGMEMVVTVGGKSPLLG